MKLSLMALGVLAAVVVGIFGVNYLQHTGSKPTGLDNGRQDLAPPVDSGTINATIISFGTEPLKGYADPTFQVRIHTNEIIEYHRFKEAGYPPLQEGEDLDIILTFGHRIKNEVVECPKGRTVTQTDNASYTGTSAVCPVLLGPPPTAEESERYLTDNIGKGIIIFVSNSPNSPQEWSGALWLPFR